MPKEKINKTNACRILDQKKIAYELIPYEVDENDPSGRSISPTNWARTSIRCSKLWC